MATIEKHDELWSALVRVVDAGQRLVVDRIELGRLDLQEALTKLGFILVGTVLGVAGWCVSMAAAALWLRSLVPLPVSLLIIGTATGVFGGLLVVIGARQSAPEAPVPIDRTASER